jgi:hypothetical protein
MNPAASGLFAARDGRAPLTDWQHDARPACAFPHMRQHARNAAAALVAAPERLRATTACVRASLARRSLGTLGNMSILDRRPARIRPASSCSLAVFLLCPRLSADARSAARRGALRRFGLDKFPPEHARAPTAALNRAPRSAPPL